MPRRRLEVSLGMRHSVARGTSASFSTKWSTSGNCSWPRVNSGPPATIVLPAARQRAMSSCADSCWAIMPLTNTTSAHARSFSRNFRTFTSTRRFAQAGGNSAATGQQAQRRQGGFLADELQGVFETPKRIRKFRV